MMPWRNKWEIHAYIVPLNGSKESFKVNYTIASITKILKKKPKQQNRVVDSNEIVALSVHSWSCSLGLD